MFKKYVKQLLDTLGYELILKKKSNHKYTDQTLRDEISEATKTIREYSMVAPEGLDSLFRQVVHCEQQNVPGAFVECGVWKGGSVGLMALANLKYGNQRRPLHLFDIFGNICEPEAEVDGERAVREVKKFAKNAGASGNLVELDGIYDHKGGPGTVEQNRFLLEETIGYPSSNIHIHKGWFQETLPQVNQDIQDIAILRLDGDWYASTKICLEYLFPKVVSGGFVVIDDYGAYDGCKKAVDEYLNKEYSDAYLHVVNEDIRYILKK